MRALGGHPRTVTGIRGVHKIYFLWIMTQTFDLQDGRSKVAALDLRNISILKSIVSALGVEAKAHAFALENIKDRIRLCESRLTRRPARPARCIADDLLMGCVMRDSIAEDDL